MKLTTAKLIVESSEELDLSLELYKGYSGRGMFGSKTSGVTGRHSAFACAVADASAELAESHGKNSTEWEEFITDLENLRVDNMGMDLIFY